MEYWSVGVMAMRISIGSVACSLAIALLTSLSGHAADKLLVATGGFSPSVPPFALRGHADLLSGLIGGLPGAGAEPGPPAVAKGRDDGDAVALTGDFDYVLKICVRDLDGLRELVNGVLLQHKSVDRVRSEIVLEILRDDHILALDL